MEFKRARSKEQFKQREIEIINAAISIYEESGFEEVTFSKISNYTNFTRPTIYSYFKTKEEIMLKLASIYFGRWALNLSKKLSVCDKTNSGVATCFYQSFLEEDKFINLYNLLYMQIEKNVSLEALVEFKKAQAMQNVRLVDSLNRIYLDSSYSDLHNFLLFSLCFASGLFPMSNITSLQKEAIKLSNTNYNNTDLEFLFTNTLIVQLNHLK